MPMFRYRAYGARGELAEGAVDAVSERAATDLLWTQGLTAFEMRHDGEAGKPWWQRDLVSMPSGSRKGELAAFTREFATLNGAEVPLDDALRILSGQATSASMRALAAALLADVLDGATLSDAMQKRPRIFPPDYVSVVRAGEIGGTVDVVFGELANLLERRAQVRARIQSALVYPVILIGLSLVSVGIIIGGTVPSIAPIFADNGRPMPAAMSVIVSLEGYWREALIAIAVLAAVIAAAAALIARRPASRLAYQRRLLRLPVYGAFTLKRETAQFARTLGTLLRAGVPLLQAATSARTVISNGHVGAGIDRAIDDIREGTTLYRALRTKTALPPIALQIISIGEEAGRLDRMLIRLAEMLELQTQQSTERFMSALTPALTVGIAILIGGMIMTVISAILSINEIPFR
ncbi:MAG: type II secretion system F family protein [Xanthobacteraceae bacterium]|jgi:general secretion pathway protein F